LTSLPQLIEHCIGNPKATSSNSARGQFFAMLISFSRCFDGSMWLRSGISQGCHTVLIYKICPFFEGACLRICCCIYF